MSKKRFLEDQGFTCKNWQWSWSFINYENEAVVFTEWSTNLIGNKGALIFSSDWERDANGRKNNAYNQSKWHLEHHLEAGFSLSLLRIYPNENPQKGKSKIDSFDQVLRPAKAQIHKTNVYAFYDANEPVSNFGSKEKTKTPRHFDEGSKYNIELTITERHRAARAECLRIHGNSCKVCGLNFGEKFGKIGEGFIHVHHIVPISERDEQYKVNPEKDLVPLCPNCHAMAHRKKHPFTVSELKELLKTP